MAARDLEPVKTAQQRDRPGQRLADGRIIKGCLFPDLDEDVLQHFLGRRLVIQQPISRGKQEPGKPIVELLETQAIALAGGWDKTAALHKARVLRASVNGGEREEISANVKAIIENKAPDLQLRPDDILYVPNSLGKSVTVRSLEAAISVGTGVAIWH